MSNQNIITSLDIGTGSIKGIIAVKKQNFSNFEILAQSRKNSLGIRKGAVIDADEVSKNISFVINELERQSARKIEEVFINLNGSHIFCLPSRGSVVVSRADQRISQEDIDRVIESAQAFSLPKNKEILEIFVREYIVDNERKIKQPLDMQGVRLEAEVLAVCAFSPYIKNLTDAVLESGVQIADIIISPLASSSAMLTPEQKELGVVLIDIGAGTTSMAVYNEGDLIYTTVIPVGSSLITEDIAVGFQTEMDIAEKLKKEFGTCVLTNLSRGKKDKITLKEYPDMSFSRKMLVKIINARVCEIFAIIHKELKKNCSQFLLPGGVVLAGGGAKIPKIVEIVKKELKLPTRLGSIKAFSDLTGAQKDISMSVVCGLAIEGLNLTDEDSSSGDIVGNINKIIKKIIDKLKKLFKIFVP
ncbi:MAG: cell division protein FtsA [Patescibacteria group bacterium]|nr:cell division protein FtsA [Patescibacteria group bacterium]